MAKIQTVSILGCGWYGLALAKELVNTGFTVKGSRTTTTAFGQLRQEGILPFRVVVEPGTVSFEPGFFHCDLLIISIPPKRAEAVNYPEKITAVRQAIRSHSIKRVLLISSTGVYGDFDRLVDEHTPPQPDSESGKALLAAEELLKTDNEFRTSLLRFAGLIGPGRDPGRFFAGKKQIPNGKAPVNLIRLEDCIGITLAIIRADAFGHTLNACAPEHPEKMDFYTKAAALSGLEMPEFIPELNHWKIVSSAYSENLLGYTIGPLWPVAG